mgnify:CR=1 FL=1
MKDPLPENLRSDIDKIAKDPKDLALESLETPTPEMLSEGVVSYIKTVIRDMRSSKAGALYRTGDIEELVTSSIYKYIGSLEGFRDLKNPSNDFSAVCFGTIVSHTISNNGKVTLLTDRDHNVKGRRFLSRRRAKLWAKTRYGRIIFDITIRPTHPVNYIDFEVTI